MEYGEFLAILADVAKVRPFVVNKLTRDLRTADGMCLCPIATVAQMRFGYLVHNHQAVAAGLDIGLPSALVYDIIHAADNGGSMVENGPEIRADLLRACGLPNGEVTLE